MKLKINKAFDLSSISVLPPNARRANLGSSASEAGKVAGMSQPLRSQSQQSFSQAASLSQLSQSSFEENVAADQRFGSQERDNSSKRMISTLGPITSTRDESQLQLSRTSNNVFRRWNSSSIPDNRCQVNGELEHRFRLIESSLNRMGLILDSVQSDVMQVNRATKEVSLDTEGLRQKMMLIENSMQQLLKGEEDIKAFLDENLKSTPDKAVKEFDCNKLLDIESAISTLPQKIEAHFLKVQHAVCRTFTQEMEVIMCGMNSLKAKHLNPACSPTMNGKSSKSNHFPLRSPVSRSHIAMQQSERNQIQEVDIPVVPPPLQKGWTTVSKTDPEFPRALKPKLTDQKPKIALMKEELCLRSKEKDCRVVIESDEESDGVSCLLVKKETGRESYLAEEAREETMRILRKARKRRRRQCNAIILV